MKQISILVFLIFICFKIYPLKDPVINKIVAEKILIDFDQTVLINVFLNPMNAIDVVVFFNDEEIKTVNNNLKPLLTDDKEFLPSFSFEVNKVKESNSLKVFVVLSQGITVNSETRIFFEKGDIIDKNELEIEKDRIFFIKAGKFLRQGTFYDLEIDNPSNVKKIDEIVKEDTLYFQLKSLKSGTAKLLIKRYDEEVPDQKGEDVKTIKLNIKN
jgi:hypothetical protein